MKCVGSGELFCIPPVPPGRVYELVARAHPRVDGPNVAIVASWTREEMEHLIHLLDPEGFARLLSATWLSLSRNSEEREVLLALPVVDRLLFALQRLARRFPHPHPSGTMVDLRMPNPFLASLVGANRSTVSRSLGRLVERGLLIRTKDLVVVPFPAAA